MRSIVQTDDSKCYLCGGTAYWNDNDILERLEKHHIFGGNPNRKIVKNTACSCSYMAKNATGTASRAYIETERSV